MKKELLLFGIMTILLPLKLIIPQTLNDYILEMKGDTLVVKDHHDMNKEPNSLNYALLFDTPFRFFLQGYNVYVLCIYCLDLADRCCSYNIIP